MGIALVHGVYLLIQPNFKTPKIMRGVDFVDSSQSYLNIPNTAENYQANSIDSNNQFHNCKKVRIGFSNRIFTNIRCFLDSASILTGIFQ